MDICNLDGRPETSGTKSWTLELGTDQALHVVHHLPQQRRIFLNAQCPFAAHPWLWLSGPTSTSQSADDDEGLRGTGWGEGGPVYLET